jgi:hypothetical protein
MDQMLFLGDSGTGYLPISRLALYVLVLRFILPGKRYIHGGQFFIVLLLAYNHLETLGPLL